VAPDVSRKLLQRWDASLGEMAVPLGPERRFLGGEVKGIDDVPPLPPIVARRLRPGTWVGAVWDLTQPGAGGVDRIDVEGQLTGPQTAPGDSSSDTTRATRRAFPRAIRSSGF
jgi:hypothetical protein